MSTAVPAPPPNGRMAKTVRDMAISLGVIAIPLVLLMAFCRPAPQDTPTVDPSGTFRAAKAAAPYHVRVPSPSPAGWRASNAALRTDSGVTLRVSYLTAGGRYVQLLQTDRAADVVIPEELGGGLRRGTERVGTSDWQHYGGRRDGESALVLLEPKVTVILVGNAQAADLTALAASLR